MDELQEKVEAMYLDDIDKVEKGENMIKQLMKKKQIICYRMKIFW